MRKSYSFTSRDLSRSDQLLRRAMGAYFRMGGNEQPDRSMSSHHMVERNPEADMTDYLQYVRLANVNGTLAVYRLTNRGELKRLRRWPQTIEDGTANIYPEIDWTDEKLQASPKQLLIEEATAVLAELDRVAA